MACTTEDIRHQLADFFKRMQKLSFEEKKNDSLNRPKGWFEELRAESFGALNSRDVSVKEGGFWAKLNAKIYVLSLIGEISAVLAYYDDNTILWLDDHSSDDGFDVFVKNERLWTWLPERKDDLIALLIGTKLNYLGRPQLINTILDIPSISKENLESYANDSRVQSQLIKSRQRLEYISKSISPPTLSTKKDVLFELSFFVWTKIMGKVVHVQFELDQDGLFVYEGNELTGLVGRYLVPR